MKRTVALLAGVVFAGCYGFGPSAQAGFVVTLEQQGSNVVASGSGTLDVTDLTFGTTGTTQALIFPSDAVIFTGPASTTAGALYTGFAGPTSFGSGSPHLADSGSGDLVGVNGFFDELIVPLNYSGGALSDSAVWDNATFGSLGVNPGTYVWSWGSGNHADSFTLDIGAVPEPASLSLFGIALLGLGWFGWRRRESV